MYTSYVCTINSDLQTVKVPPTPRDLPALGLASSGLAFPCAQCNASHTLCCGNRVV